MNLFIVKSIWRGLEITLIFGALFTVFHIYTDINENPLVISLETDNYHIRNFPFPAVAICNINKISKKRVEQYAHKIAKTLKIPFPIVNDLKRLGNLYDYNINDAGNLVRIQTMIEKYENLINSTNNVYDIMKNLVTPCKEFILECIWKTDVYNCSELFELRSTYNGFCCTFNYPKRSSRNRMEQRLSSEGKENGLIITVRNEIDDYFFPDLPALGLGVLIFTPTDYPDATSGRLLYQILPIGTEAFFNLEPQKFYSVEEVRKYPINLRKCIFYDEKSTIFGGYSYSNCLVECRIKSILALCECVPFLMPNQKNYSCTLSDLRCLNKYQDKWRNSYPLNFQSDELDKEKENSLVCNQCHPDCTGVTYKLKFSSISFNKYNKGLVNFERFNVIRVYYENSNGRLFKQDVVYYWYETISNVGGIMGIFLGLSFISIIEFLQRIVYKIVRTTRKFLK